MKKLLFIICLSVLLSNNALSDTDCSEIKKLTKEYIKCLAKRSKEKTSNLGLDVSNIKEKKYLSDWFKKKK
tara:strand:- start:238 stop:450 length:213 start_codon:yes stop_codon:yes gene_type:complete